LILSIAVG